MSPCLHHCRAFDSEIVGNAHDAVSAAVREHAAWLTANVDNQMSYYTGKITPILCFNTAVV